MVKKPIYSFYNLRVIACIGIVLLHTLNGAIGLYGSTISVNEQIISLTVKNLLLWCVPCFVMVTGALLLNPEKEISYVKLFKKYILRIIFALLFCCIVFSIFDLIVHGDTFTFHIIVEIIQDFFLGTSWSHLWYLYLIIGLYLMIPIYKIITKNAKSRDIKYILILYLIFLSIMPTLNIFGLNISFYILVSTIYPFYAFFGYAYYQKIIELRNYQSLLLIILSSIGLVLVNIYQYKFGYAFLEVLLNYSSILVVLQSVGIFALFVNFKGKSNKVIESLDSASFGIYLLHMIFVRLILKYLEFNPYNFIPLVSFFILVITVVLCSYVIVFILKKLPVFNKFL